jgi:hypothetical protein
MPKTRRHEIDGQTHHPPKTVEQQSEDSFPTSDPPSFAGGHAIGAPVERKSRALGPNSQRVRDAERKVKTGKAKNSRLH